MGNLGLYTGGGGGGGGGGVSPGDGPEHHATTDGFESEDLDQKSSSSRWEHKQGGFIEKQRGSECSVSISDLICREDITDLDVSDGEEENYCTKSIPLNALTETEKDYMETDTEEEYIETLVSRETSFVTRCHDLSSCSESPVAGNGWFKSIQPAVAAFGLFKPARSTEGADGWFKSARSAAVRWILKTSARFGFRPQTVYLALSYFDLFFARWSTHKEKPWAVPLSSIACLSVAAKMEEHSAPALSMYPTEYGFESSALERMELFLLNTLDWRMSLVTPFDYLSYFAYKFHQQHGPRDLLHEANGFIFATVEVINLVDYRPSAMAVAAILAASTSERLTKELVESKMTTISLSGAIKIEHVFSCYSVMTQESDKKLKISTTSTSSHSSTNCSSVNDVVDVIDSASFVASSNKRRRLH